MKPIKDFDSVKVGGEFTQLPAGGYICMIKGVEDVPDKNYLRIEYDIATGEYAGYFSQMQERLGWNNGRFFRSYKETALRMFKAFTTAVENSNEGYKWAWDENSLKAKLVGIVLGEEEYTKNTGETGTRLYVSAVRSIEAISNGDFKIPEKKTITPTNATTSDLQPLDSELPF